jgi:CRISPR/Cas system-associated protein Cas10 (large subunit of type III CRISPR-Cas system)
MKEEQDQFNRLFVGGDLSGIQSFLYNISSKRAAVSLKGRSRYLSDYMGETCDKLMAAAREAGSKELDPIYCSGGKFYLITDNTPAIRQAIDQCAKVIKQDLWKEHYGQLGINIAHTPFTENTDGTVNTPTGDRQKPGELWRMVNAEFAKQKNQKFKDIISADFDSYFKPIAIGDKPKVCAITGIESDECVSYTYRSPEGDDTTMLVLPSVREQIRLGETLNREEGAGMTFEDYADGSYLGVLRMDVDGLGKRFISGFDSIEAYKAFSKRLVDFFENEIQLIRLETYYKDYINVIYAGGDDLFIVGRWDKTIAIAQRIHYEVEKRFKSEGISISGGVAIVKPKFPIAKAAELAGDAEDAAKHFKNGSREKNAFHFLGKTISWEDEFDYVVRKKDEFVDMIEEFDLSKSILHKLMLYASVAQKNEQRKAEGKFQDYSYLWHASYYLTRYIKRYEKNRVAVDFVKNLRDKEITLNGGQNLQLIALAARWAELQLREFEQQ